MDMTKRADIIKNLHENTWKTIQDHVNRHTAMINKNKTPRIFEEGNLVWIHLSKDRFPHERNSKLKPRSDGPFKVLKRINDNAYIIDIPTSKYLVSNTFNIKDLSPFHGEMVDEESRSTLSQGGDDVGGLWTPQPQDCQVPHKGQLQELELKPSMKRSICS
jgi:hypothetical protein